MTCVSVFVEVGRVESPEQAKKLFATTVSDDFRVVILSQNFGCLIQHLSIDYKKVYQTELTSLLPTRKFLQKYKWTEKLLHLFVLKEFCSCN